MDDDTDVGDVDGIEESTAEKLRDGGYETFGDIRGVDRSALFEVEGIGATRASNVLSAVEEATGGAVGDGGSETEDDGGASDGSTADDGTSSESESDSDSDDESNGGSGGDDSESASGGSDGDAGTSIVEIRDAARTTTAELIGHDLDGVIQVTADGDGWIAVVEVVERHSVPDTQDILGRYELELDDSARVTGYQRVGRYRRADSDVDEY